jgi:hypothetical protein
VFDLAYVQHIAQQQVQSRVRKWPAAAFLSFARATPLVAPATPLQLLDDRAKRLQPKNLAGLYLPGRRSGRWLKIKPARSVPCVVIGWQPGRWGVRGLLVAAVWDGRLQYVAKVRTGFTMEERRWPPSILAGLGRARPVVPCPHPGLWLEPVVICQVSYLDWTRAGRLRGASFRGMLTTAGLPLAFGLGGLTKERVGSRKHS